MPISPPTFADKPIAVFPDDAEASSIIGVENYVLTDSFVGPFSPARIVCPFAILPLPD